MELEAISGISGSNSPAGSSTSVSTLTSSVFSTNVSMMDLRQILQRLTHEINQLRQDWNSYSVWSMENAELLLSLDCRRHEINELLIRLVHSSTYVLNQILIPELNNWKKDQQHAQNGAQPVVSLDSIQMVCEEFASILKDSLNLAKDEINILSIENVLGETYMIVFNAEIDKLMRLMTSLIMATFIVDTQPLQVVKIAQHQPAKLPGASVRLLVGGLFLQNPEGQHAITAKIVNEREAMEISSGRPMNAITGTGTLEFNKVQWQTQHARGPSSSVKYIGQFRHLKLMRIIRETRTAERNEMVTDSKFFLYFQSKVKSADTEINMWTLSLPIVVTTHNCQDAAAWGTIIWHNAFAKNYQVDDEVAWKDADALLCRYFTMNTKATLSESHRRFLKMKAFGSVNPVSDSLPQSYFRKRQMFPDQTEKFTFFEWFYATMKMTKLLIDLWNEDAIVGYMSRDDAEQLLMLTVEGTFLLRFSDCVKGGISIMYRSREGVISFVPFTAKPTNFFNHNFLANVILEVPQFRFLYKNNAICVDKFEVFMQHGNVSFTEPGSPNRPPYLRLTFGFPPLDERTRQLVTFTPPIQGIPFEAPSLQDFIGDE